MTRVRRDREILPRHSTYTGECSNDMVVVSQELGRKCTIPTGSCSVRIHNAIRWSLGTGESNTIFPLSIKSVLLILNNIFIDT